MKRLLIPLALLALAAPRARSPRLGDGGSLAARRRRGGGGHLERPGEHPPARRDPLSGLSPTVTIRNTRPARRRRSTPSRRTRPRLRRKVVFPSEGKWSYEVYDGFSQYGGAKTHTFGSVDIGTGGGGSLPAFGIIGIVGLALVAIVFFYWLSRRVRVRARRPRASAFSGRAARPPARLRTTTPQKGRTWPSGPPTMCG